MEGLTLPELHEELKKISGLIDELIKKDDFIEAISPRFLRKAVTDYPYTGGKRIRPAILMWCCSMLGGNPDAAQYAAAAMEIYHNWTLVHDDIIDNDNLRRGLPSTHKSVADFSVQHLSVPKRISKKFGIDYAILAGDIQQGWAVNMLLKSAEHGVSNEVAIALCRRLQEYVNRLLISGQGLDMSYPFRDMDSFVAEEIENMLYMKTAVLLSFCAEAGSAIALNCTDFKDDRIAALNRFATFTGVAFQLRDDWLGIFGEASKTGKTLFSDLISGKPTVLVVKTIDSLSPNDRKEFRSYIGLRKYTPELKEKVRSFIRNSGAEKFVLDKIAKLTADAKELLRTFPDNSQRQLLIDMVDWLLERDR